MVDRLRKKGASMGINKGERFEIEDIFVAYPYEGVMYRGIIVVGIARSSQD